MMGTECITASLGEDPEPSIPPGFGPFAALALQGIHKDAKPADVHPSPVQVLQSVKKHVESLEGQPHSAQSRNDIHCSTSGSHMCRQSLRNRPPVDYSRFDNMSDDEDSDVEIVEKVPLANVLFNTLFSIQLKFATILMCSHNIEIFFWQAAASLVRRRQQLPRGVIRGCAACSDCQKVHIHLPNSRVTFMKLSAYVISYHAGYCKLESSWCAETCS